MTLKYKVCGNRNRADFFHPKFAMITQISTSVQKKKKLAVLLIYFLLYFYEFCCTFTNIAAHEFKTKSKRNDAIILIEICIFKKIY